MVVLCHSSWVTGALFGVRKNFIVKGLAFYWMTSSEVKSVLIKAQSLKHFSERTLSFFRRSTVIASNVFSFPIHKASYNFFLWLSFILKFSQTFSLTQDVPCTSLMNIIKYCDYELSYLPKHDFQTLLYLPKRKKKSMFAFDSCYRKLLVKSEAQQSRLCICQSLPRESCQRQHCHQLEIPVGGGVDRCSYEVEVGLSESRKHFLLQVRIKWPKYFQDWLSVCYSCFQTWLRHFGGISYIILLIGRHCTCLIQHMNNLDILNWLKNVLLLQIAGLQF